MSKLALRPLDELLRELDEHVESNERDPDFLRREEARAKAKAQRQARLLRELAADAKSGAYGEVGKKLWAMATQKGEDLSTAALEQLAKELRGRTRVK